MRTQTPKAISWARAGDTIRYTFADNPAFTFSATIALTPDTAEPTLAYTLTPKIAGWFSVCCRGAPQIARADADEFWQPFIWQEKRFPAPSFMTPGFQCHVATTIVRKGDSVLRVVVNFSELPFNPLPLLDNSRFGVALRTPEGAARTMASFSESIRLSR